MTMAPSTPFQSSIMSYSTPSSTMAGMSGITMGMDMGMGGKSCKISVRFVSF